MEFECTTGSTYVCMEIFPTRDNLHCQKTIHSVSSAVNKWSLLLTCFGNVLLQEMYGPFAEEKFRNALTMLKIFSCYFVG